LPLRGSGFEGDRSPGTNSSWEIELSARLAKPTREGVTSTKFHPFATDRFRHR
jgi:hypothetical protein